jgi:hypothetical protein
MAHGLVSTGVSFPAGTTQTIGTSQSLSASGYSKTPDGTIIQWGTASAGTVSTTFPIAFPTALLSISATSISTGDTCVVYSGTTTGFNSLNVYASVTKYWIAVGY